jgi:hypothetical protein
MLSSLHKAQLTKGLLAFLKQEHMRGADVLRNTLSC